MLHLMHERWGSLSREDSMDKDQKIKAALEAIKESVDVLRTMSKEEPDLLLSNVTVRGWIFATQIHIENLEVLLHDLQPTLF